MVPADHRQPVELILSQEGRPARVLRHLIGANFAYLILPYHFQQVQLEYGYVIGS